jgi:Ca2+-binding EF-hand superfamily protein
MQKSASAPAFPFLPSASKSSSSICLSGVERERLPIGVKPLVASRMRLDATISPAMLELRMNTRNLVNEMKYNGGKIVSHQFSLMKPRRNQKWEKPKDISKNKEMEKLQRRMGRIQSRKLEAERSQRLEDSPGSKKGSKQPPPEENKKHAHEHKLHGASGSEEGPALIALDDPSLDIEIARLLEDPRIEEVWRMMQTQACIEASEQHGGEEAVPGLSRSRVARAIEALGHASPDKETVEESLACLPGSAPLDLNEFTSIVAVFNRQRRLHLREQFNQLDEDNSGTCNIREFSHLLWDMGFTVTLETVKEYLMEADHDHSGEVEFSEFEQACHFVHQRHGFNKREVEEFEGLFDRYDSDGSNEMEADELASALGWFGSPCTLEEARAIIERFDDDGNGCLAKPEFLMVMRQRLEDEIAEMRSLFHDFDTDESGTMDIGELLELFRKCGYTITAEVIKDALKVALPNLHNRQNADLVFEDVLKVFYLVRKREGFSEKELAELTDVYERHDKGGQGELREFELARCFNWLGYPLSQQRRRELWCRVDVDKTESIELGEFLKLVRLLREEETVAARAVLQQSEAAGQKSHLDEHVLKNMLIQLGYAPPQNIITEAVQQSGDSSGDGVVDLFGVLGIFNFIRQKQVAKLRASAGISDQQAAKISGKFNLRFQSGKVVELSELEKVMYDLFPALKHQDGEKEKLRELMKEQTGGNPIKEMMEAFWIVRGYCDMRDENKWHREQKAAADAGFTNWQVASFREAFVAADTNADGCLSQREIRAVFESLMSMKLNQHEAMSQQLHKMGDKKDFIEFCEFLRVMYIVLAASEV